MAATHYEVLGVSPNATQAEIREAYLKLISHLTTAHDVLSNPSEKEHYDFTLELKQLLTDVAKINTRDNFGFSALMRAAEKGYLDAVELLIDSGADLNLRNDNVDDDYFQEWAQVRSALILAAENGHFDVVKLLVGRKAKIDFSEGGKEISALALAAENGHLEIVKFLIEKGAQIEWDEGTSPLMRAARQGHVEVMRCLIAAKANIRHASCNEEGTPLIAAVEGGDIAAVQLLFDFGVGLCPDALACAKENGREDIVALFIEYGAELNSQEEYISDDILTKKRKVSVENEIFSFNNKRLKFESDDVLQVEADAQEVALQLSPIDDSESEVELSKEPIYHPRNPLAQDKAANCSFFPSKGSLAENLAAVSSTPEVDQSDRSSRLNPLNTASSLGMSK